MKTDDIHSRDDQEIAKTISSLNDAVEPQLSPATTRKGGHRRNFKTPGMGGSLRMYIQIAACAAVILLLVFVLIRWGGELRTVMSPAGVKTTAVLNVTASPNATVAMTTAMPTAAVTAANGAIVFKDAVVEARIRKILKKTEGDITAADMEYVQFFDYDPMNDKTADGPITSLDDLRYCVYLETLNVRNQPITSIECLRGLSRLTLVNVSGCSISDLSPLSGKEYLEVVWMSGNPVIDASPVLSLPSLRDFNASQTKITDISALSNTSNLDGFYCFNELDDYTPLLGHKRLQYLSVTNISNEEFKAMLGSCPSLRTINIQNSQLQDASLDLLKDYDLIELTLINCGIKEISALSSLTTLKNLWLKNNNIENIKPLSNLTQLVWIDLRNNRIKDFSPLLNMTLLENLMVTYNPYTDLKVLNKIAEHGCKVWR